MDIAITRIHYEAALFLKGLGQVPQDKEFYEGKCNTKYDIDLFLEFLEEGRDPPHVSIFFEKIRSKLDLY
jgi:hypothetical protein